MRSWKSPHIPSISLPIPELRLWDTSSRSITPTNTGDSVNIYVCGITPYDATHLGHAATYLTFDVINRIFRAQGKKVNFVQNITDIDDPLFERAQRDGISWEELADRETMLFRSDMEALSIIPPARYVGATEVIPEIISAVHSLLEDGHAYRADDPQYPDVYFPISATDNFGYISHLDRNEMLRIFAERGGDPDRPGKKDPLDALLWRMARPGEPSWDSPMGAGRPGWHIECSIISTQDMQLPIDIQGGGCDLKYPHHEYSAAHTECLQSEPRFARHYVHTGMLGLDGEKMSKSLGNLVFVSKLLEQGIDPRVIRLALLDANYYEDRMWTNDFLTQAQRRLEGWIRACEPGRKTTDPVGAAHTCAEFLSDNLRLPQALHVIDHWAQQTNDGLGNYPEGGKVMSDFINALLGVTV